MGRNLPDGNRVYVKPKIGGKVRACRMKSGTAEFLGLKPQPIEKGKGDSIKRGSMGTKSFTLLLKRETRVGGANVVSLAHPVPGDVKVLDFYRYAKGKSAVAGIRTPDGISYMWDDWAGSGGGGGGGFPNPLDNLDPGDIGDLIDFIGDVGTGQNLAGALAELGLDIVSD
jgi:hypothetical protein